MANIMPSHHGGVGGDEPPKHPPNIVPADCQFTLPPKRRQHYKSLTIFQSYNKLQGPIPVQFDLEGETFYVVGEYSEYYIRHIGSLIRQLIPQCYLSWKVVPEELTQVEVKKLNLTQFSLKKSF